MSLISISDDVYIDPVRVEAVQITSDMNDRQYVQITLQNSILNIPLGKATLNQVVEKINDACTILKL